MRGYLLFAKSKCHHKYIYENAFINKVNETGHTIYRISLAGKRESREVKIEKLRRLLAMNVMKCLSSSPQINDWWVTDWTVPLVSRKQTEVLSLRKKILSWYTSGDCFRIIEDNSWTCFVFSYTLNLAIVSSSRNRELLGVVKY